MQESVSIITAAVLTSKVREGFILILSSPPRYLFAEVIEMEPFLG